MDNQIASEVADDGCTNITLTCTRKKGQPTITFSAENTCLQPVSEVVFNASALHTSNKLDSIMDRLAVIENNTG